MLVVNRKLTQRFDVYVGRPSQWGNPFTVAEYGRTAAIAAYARWLLDQPMLLAQLPSLRDRVLACWCAPLPCHADVLVWLANGDSAARLTELRRWACS